MVEELYVLHVHTFAFTCHFVYCIIQFLPPLTLFLSYTNLEDTS